MSEHHDAVPTHGLQVDVSVDRPRIDKVGPVDAGRQPCLRYEVTHSIALTSVKGCALARPNAKAPDG